MSEQQNFSNHTKTVPPFHLFVLPVLLANLVWVIIKSARILIRGELTFWLVVAIVFSVLFALALVVLALFARLFALGAQDRVIRLEERLRYEKLLPDDLKPRIGEFTINQLVALRFASDTELPTLARKVLDGKIDNRKAIKQMIQNWRPDYQRV